MSKQSLSGRGRIRHVLPTLYLGRWNPGRLNSITDVPGVLVDTQSIQPDQSVNTGVTTILPRRDWFESSSFAGVFRFNGCGEMTGAHWINEAGVLCSPIVITGTPSVGEGYRGITQYFYNNHGQEAGVDLFMFPLVAETYDGYLSDPTRFAVTPQHVMDGIKNASAERVAEGNTGGGTGMICHRFKGGTGSSSRLVPGYDSQGNQTTYTVGVLVQANYGMADTLHIGGVPVGHLMADKAPTEKPAVAPGPEPRKDGSIIIIVATDAPLLPIQLQRLARRATVGLAKVGGYGHNNSGDIFLAFSTGNKVPFQIMSSGADADAPKLDHPVPRDVRMTDNDSINGLFEAAGDATEEAIYNALCMAETMTGFKDRKVEALDLDLVRQLVEQRI
ncbi:hypothetical protein CDD81_876 [Ophiocordyceps australis]|uniref:Peptidase S58 DmpA n=1 Tax=Ophiocordyceps australis TaxID=1399860 RepID=A0A2C5XKT5_9HYPO|nr:hypothetical protein CDD81_876 [Ophiocordyceps australis]